MKRILLTVAGVLTIAGAGSLLQPGHASAQRMHAVAPSYYLALGDSLSLSPFAPPAVGRRTCVATLARSGFVCPLWESLRRSTPSLRAVNLALATSPAEDSCSFRSIAGCSCSRCAASGPSDQPIREDLLTGDALSYDPTRTSQLSAALSFILEHAGQVKVISLEIGGADLQEMAAQEPLTPAAEEATAGRLSENFAAIAESLREAAPDARLILMDAIDPLTPLLKSHDSVVHRVAVHMQPFYAAFSRVVAAEARGLGAIHAAVWQAFQSRTSERNWARGGAAGTLTVSGYRLYRTTVWRAYVDYSAAHRVFLPTA